MWRESRSQCCGQRTPSGPPAGALRARRCRTSAARVGRAPPLHARPARQQHHATPRGSGSTSISSSRRPRSRANGAGGGAGGGTEPAAEAGDGGGGGGGALRGYATLVAVTVLWGSYSPALRFLFAADDALTPARLTAARAAISAGALLAATGAAALWRATRARRGSDEGGGGDAPAPTAAAAAPPLPLGATLLAGLELGAWNFAGTASQALGLELTTATKAAFLVQVTGVLTPVFARAAGQAVPPGSWAACGAALLGSCLIAADGMVGGGGGGGGLSGEAPPASAQQQRRQEGGQAAAEDSRVCFATTAAPPLAGGGLPSVCAAQAGASSSS